MHTWTCLNLYSRSANGNESVARRIFGAERSAWPPSRFLHGQKPRAVRDTLFSIVR